MVWENTRLKKWPADLVTLSLIMKLNKIARAGHNYSDYSGHRHLFNVTQQKVEHRQKLEYTDICFMWHSLHVIQKKVGHTDIHSMSQGVSEWVHFALCPQKWDGLLGMGMGGEKRTKEWRLDCGYCPKKTSETVDCRQNNGSVKAVSPRHCTATSALCNCCFNYHTGQSHRDNVHCTAVEEQPKAKEVQLSQPSSTSLYSWSLLS